MNGDSGLAVFIDFDDTLTTNNVAQAVLKRLVPEALAAHSHDYRAGKITFREYQERSFDAANVPTDELRSSAVELAILRQGIKEFVAIAEAGSVPVTVLSAGLDIYIQPVLQKHNLTGLPVISGSASRPESETGPFRYDYPFGSTSTNGCAGDWATCKCKALEQVPLGTKTVFVGDGSTSDVCAAGKADYVFARDRLLRQAEEKSISVTSFEDFTPITEFVENFSTVTKA